MDRTERSRHHPFRRVCVTALAAAMILSCRHGDGSGSGPLPPVGGPDAGSSPAHPPRDDTTTGEPIGPISAPLLDIGGFGPGGSGGLGGVSGSGGVGSVAAPQ